MGSLVVLLHLMGSCRGWDKQCLGWFSRGGSGFSSVLDLVTIGYGYRLPTYGRDKFNAPSENIVTLFSFEFLFWRLNLLKLYPGPLLSSCPIVNTVTGKLLQLWVKQMVSATHSIKMETYIKRHIQKMDHHHCKTVLSLGNYGYSVISITYHLLSKHLLKPLSIFLLIITQHSHIFLSCSFRDYLLQGCSNSSPNLHLLHFINSTIILTIITSNLF